MAAIDKIYVNNYEDWKSVTDYFKSTTFEVDGEKFELINYLYHPDSTKEEIEEGFKKQKSIPVTNTPVSVDIYLIRNCKLDVVQEYLKNAYGEEYYEILNHTSVYDTYKRNGLGKNVKFSVLKKPAGKYLYKFCYESSYGFVKQFNYNDSWWYVSVNGSDLYWRYNSNKDTWTNDLEQHNWTSSNYSYRGPLNIHRIYRMLKKWNLPSGVTVKFEHRFFDFLDFVVKTKK